ncbi:MAG: hypothetical protein K6G12_03115 [Lachnospiraceae bacterium]|nr:hypothetical protein [Lachnospiraceae bacterium]
MLKFNDKGMPVYTDPSSKLTTSIKLSILDTERRELENKRQNAEACIQSELKQTEADMREKYRAELGIGVMGESSYMSAMKDFTRCLLSSK